MKQKELTLKKDNETSEKTMKKHPCTCKGCTCGKDCFGDCNEKKEAAFNKR